MSVELEKIVTKNVYYRRVIMTTDNMQLVVMKLKASDPIPMEVHRKSDQYIQVSRGRIVVKMGKKNGPYESYVLGKGDAIIIPRGTYHSVTTLLNTKRACKLSTIYSPPHHPPNRKQLHRV